MNNMKMTINENNNILINISPDFPITYSMKNKNDEVIMEGTIYKGILSAELEDCSMECD